MGLAQWAEDAQERSYREEAEKRERQAEQRKNSLLLAPGTPVLLCFPCVLPPNPFSWFCLLLEP